MTSDGKSVGQEQYENIVKQRYAIARTLNCSYESVGNMSPVEKNFIIKYINDEYEERKKQLDEQKKKYNLNNK